jgi:hypothetical protein
MELMRKGLAIVLMSLMICTCGCSVLGRAGPTPLPTLTVHDEEELALARAEELAIAMQSIDTSDLEGWQGRVYALCNDDGRWQWEENFRRGFWEQMVAVGSFVTDEVVIGNNDFFTPPDSPNIIDQEGSLVTFVIVEGTAHRRMLDTGETSEDPFRNQMMLAKEPGGEWLLAMLDTVNLWSDEPAETQSGEL